MESSSDNNINSKRSKKSGNWFVRHKVLTVIGVLVILAIIGAAGSAGKNPSTPLANTTSNNTSSGSTSKPATTASTPKLNQPANDGKLQFTITSFQCNQSQVEDPSDSSIATTAGAPYCIVGLTVKNIQTVAQTFDSSSQYLYDSSNNQYSFDSTATITLNPESSQFMEDPTVNPGVTISGQLVYDVPSTVNPTYAMLHDSAESNGVKVNLQYNGVL